LLAYYGNLFIMTERAELRRKGNNSRLVLRCSWHPVQRPAHLLA
jgi:hypothetical protein